MRIRGTDLASHGPPAHCGARNDDDLDTASTPSGTALTRTAFGDYGQFLSVGKVLSRKGPGGAGLASGAWSGKSSSSSTTLALFLNN